MGTGYTRNDTGNNIADGNIINASDLDGEFDAVQAAFNATTGHSHDGTTGEGPQIGTAGIEDDAVTPAKVDSTATFSMAGLVLGGSTLNAASIALLDAITASASELNTLDGVTSTTAELNILDGVTATASEINTLAGITASTSELNTLNGITSSTSELNILDGALVTTTELNYLSGATSNIQTQIDNITGGTTSEFASGTAMLFQQTTAPTGWTKSTTHDNKAMRIVSGSVSSGGSVPFTTAFASQGVSGTIANETAGGSVSVTGTVDNATAGGSVSISGTTGSTTLSTSQIPSHNHSFSSDSVGFNSGTGDLVSLTTLTGAGTTFTSSTGGGSSHNHSFSGSGTLSGTPHNHNWSGTASFTGTAHNHVFSGDNIDLAVQYVDFIIAVKD